MGKQSRQKAERREARQVRGRPQQLLGELFERIRDRSHQNSRRSWEMMIEILAHHTGINSLRPEGTLSADAIKLLPELGSLEALLVEFLSSWQQELAQCADSGASITDPIGSILEEAEGTNQHMGQFFTPPSVVRLLNKLTFPSTSTPEKSERVLDPCCGTGRFAIDALVHRPRAILYNVDLDLWMVRAALVNFRLMPRFSTANMNIPGRDGRLERVIVPGGRSWILHADSLLVDLECADNWGYSWLWNPPPWQSTLKLRDFDGTYDEFRRRKPEREVSKLEQARRAKRRADQLLDIQLDEAKLHDNMLRAAKDIAVPTMPPPRTAPSFADNDFGTTDALPFSERDRLPLLERHNLGR